MKATPFAAFIAAFSIGLCVSCFLPGSLPAAPWDPAAADYAGHKGRTIYVSKLGDNSDGSSWQKAFRTIQAALLAVPDNQGGHRIVIRLNLGPLGISQPVRDRQRGRHRLGHDV